MTWLVAYINHQCEWILGMDALPNTERSTDALNADGWKTTLPVGLNASEGNNLHTMEHYTAPFLAMLPSWHQYTNNAQHICWRVFYSSNSRPQTYVPISALEDSRECLIDKISTNQHREARVVEDILLGMASMVSDGSFKNACGTSAGVLFTMLDNEMKHHFLSSQTQCQGHPMIRAHIVASLREF